VFFPQVGFHPKKSGPRRRRQFSPRWTGPWGRESSCAGVIPFIERSRLDKSTPSLALQCGSSSVAIRFAASRFFALRSCQNGPPVAVHSQRAPEPTASSEIRVGRQLAVGDIDRRKPPKVGLRISSRVFFNCHGMFRTSAASTPPSSPEAAGKGGGAGGGGGSQPRWPR